MLCGKCGKDLSAEWTACPFCGTEAVSKEIVCKSCGKKLEEGWAVCPYCKTAVGGVGTDVKSGKGENLEVRALIERGNKFSEQDYYQQAVAEFTKALIIEPDNTEALIARATSYYFGDEYKNAHNDCDRVISLVAAKESNEQMREELADAYHIKASVYMCEQDIANAKNYFKKALEFNSKDGGIYESRGFFLYNIGETANAEADFRRAIALDASLKEEIEAFKSEREEHAEADDVDIDSIIRAFVKNMNNTDWYVAPNIPQNKLYNAAAVIAGGAVKPHEIIAVYDATVFGSAKNGIVLTETAFYHRNDDQPDGLEYREITGDIEYDDNSITICSNEKKVVISSCSDYAETAELLNDLRYAALSQAQPASEAAASDDFDAPDDDGAVDSSLEAVKIVCDIDVGNRYMAKLLQKGINKGGKFQSLIISLDDYTSENYEHELLGTESPTRYIFIGGTKPDMFYKVTMQYAEHGMRHGWKGNIAALDIARTEWTEDNVNQIHSILGVAPIQQKEKGVIGKAVDGFNNLPTAAKIGIGAGVGVLGGAIALAAGGATLLFGGGNDTTIDNNKIYQDQQEFLVNNFLEKGFYRFVNGN